MLLGGLGVLQDGGGRLAALAGFVEALVMDHADLFDRPSALSQHHRSDRATSRLRR